MEEQQSHIGSRATVPNHFICPLPVWLPYTFASFGQHGLWNRKSIILSFSLSLARCDSVRLSLMHITPHIPICTDEKCQGQTTWLFHAWSEENLPVFINEAQCAERVLSHSHITAIRQACVGQAPGQCLLLCSLKSHSR